MWVVIGRLQIGEDRRFHIKCPAMLENCARSQHACKEGQIARGQQDPTHEPRREAEHACMVIQARPSIPWSITSSQPVARRRLTERFFTAVFFAELLTTLLPVPPADAVTPNCSIDAWM